MATAEGVMVRGDDRAASALEISVVMPCLNEAETLAVCIGKAQKALREQGIDPRAITRTALLTLEGERDDISGLGQTRAAHALCTNLPDAMHEHWEQPGVGHYGRFNGQRYREDVAPRIQRFIQAHSARPKPAA